MKMVGDFLMGVKAEKVVVQTVEVRRVYSWYSVYLCISDSGGECIQQMVLLQCLQHAAAASGAARIVF